MAGVSVPGSGGGGRSFDVNVNLTAFVDMMSCLLAFLMLTAIWNKMAKIDIEQVIPKVAPRQNDKDKPPKVSKIQLVVDQAGYVFNIKEGDTDREIAVLRRKPDGKLPTKELTEALSKMQAVLPKDEKGNKHKAVLLVGRDRVRYDDIVSTMDVCIGLQLTGISLGTDDAVPSLLAELRKRS